MKVTLTLIAAALACGAAFAQAPAGTARPSQEANPNASGGAAQAAGGAKVDARAGTGMGGAGSATATMGASPMDVNGDGMISRKEWDAYHGKRWGSMKPNKQGMVPWADVDASMRNPAYGGTPK
jgi:hypothetical protein